MDRGAWRGVVHKFAKSRTQLSNLACTQTLSLLFKILLCILGPLFCHAEFRVSISMI